jgi:histidinol-phosphate/aromatic aminotransferase/cobyric acid decarboxylase-like protein
MAPYRNNVISYISARAVLAALDLGPTLIKERRGMINETRSELINWLTAQKIRFIPPQANFIMIETGRPAAEVQAEMLAKGVAIGRPFPALNTMIRVSIGTNAEMMKFRKALSEMRAA